MDGKGFELMDFLQSCKFAEGDSRILMLKMARDHLNLFRKKLMNADSDPDPSTMSEEETLCLKFLSG
jgi:hypothetical protein